MTNLEICKKIAEIEGVHGETSVHAKTGCIGRRYIDGSFKPYNPLKDDALCFQFAVDDKMMLSWTECPAGSGRAYFVNVDDKSTDYFDTPNKAVCMAKLEIFL